MTNGEKFKEVFQISQVDDCDLNVYAWLPIHDAIEIPVDWWNAEYKAPTTKNDLVTLTFSKGTLKYSCKDYVVYKKDWFRSHYGAEINIMFGDSQYKPTTKNNLGVACVDKRKAMCYTCRFCKMDIRDGKPYCSLREKGGKCYAYDNWESQEDVLDKIRAEIEKEADTSNRLHSISEIGLRKALKIIDKYKTESEG